MKKRLYAIVIAILFIVANATAQVKIGNNPSNINPTSLLELESTNKGLLLPRLADTTSITAPPKGMLIYDNKDSSVYVKNISFWQKLTPGLNSTIWQQYNNLDAVYGSGGAGIAVQHDYPSVGFNSYYDGSTYKSIGAGYSAEIGVDQSSGAFYVANFPNFSSAANTSLPLLNPNFYVANGKVGIGVNPPQSDLHIYQNSINIDNNDGTNGITFEFSDLKYGDTKWNITSANICAAPNQGTCVYERVLAFGYNGFTQAVINQGGEYVQVSDRSRKKDITYLDEQPILPKLLQLQPASYLMKTEKETDKLHYGFISQDVEKIFPEIVTDENGLKMLSYQSFIPIVVKAIQEQQQQINDYKKDNATLQQQLQSVMTLVQQLQQQVNALTGQNKNTQKADISH